MLGYVKRCNALLNLIPVSSQQLFTFKVIDKFYTVRFLSHFRKYSISHDVEKTGDYPDESAEKDPFMKNEIKKYNTGKRWLARMMGVDAETFTQKDIDEAIQYLLPSHLWAKDARPSMKHPYDIFPKSKESKFDEHGRPYSSAFYTGKPQFHNLVYDMWCHAERLNNPASVGESNLALEQTKSYASNGEQTLSSGPKIMQWVKKFQLEQIMNEPMSDKNYDVIIFRLKKLANHARANEIQDFLGRFQVPVYTSGKEELKEVDVYENASRAMGYRKTAIAEVIVREGSGTITVNTRPLLEYFHLPNDREQVMFPLLVINELDRFNIEAHVIGGGPSGKSGAVRLGISRAIAALCPQHFDALCNARLLIRDYREKERKKPGRKKARRAFQWVKR